MATLTASTLSHTIRSDGARHSVRPGVKVSFGCTAMTLALTACMPALDTPEARRSAYLDCARDQGLTVTGDTIQTRGPADLDRLQACQAIPR